MPPFPLPSQRVANGQPWYEQVPIRTRQIIGAATGGLVALLLLFTVARWYHHSQPGYVLEVFDGINSPADVQRQSDYLTPQGNAILLWVLSKRGDKPASNERPVYSSPIITGDTCDVPVRQGKVTGTVRLVKTDHWRFHDLYVEKLGDKKVELWVSYAKDHPFGAWVTTYGGEFFVAFCKGVLIGAALAP